VKLIHSLFALALALLFSVSAFADDLTGLSDPRSGFSSSRLGRIASWYQARVDGLTASDPTMPGAVVAIAKDGKLAYLQAIGFQDRAKTIPMKTDSIFWIASMTKPITSVAAMILVDDGKLELDAPVSRYLPELKDMQVAREVTDATTGEGGYALEPQKRAMTVRDLLRHTAGFIYPEMDYVRAEPGIKAIHTLYGMKAAFGADDSLADFVASLAALPLAHQPGEVWEYSWGVDVLARVVEVASGEPFDQFLESRLFGPLHMVDTGFYVPEGKLARLVDPPVPERDPRFDFARPRRLLSGGGGLASTAPDCLRFCQMLLNGGVLDGVRVLTPKAVREMTSDQLPPSIRFAGNALGPDTGSSWGLGFQIRTDPEHSYVPGSVGSFRWSGLWGTYFWVDPAEKLITVEMIQAAPGKAGPAFGAIRRLTYGALRVLAPEDFVAPPSPLGVSADTLAEYVGKYAFGSSTSAHDLQADHPRLGFEKLDVENGVFKVSRMTDGGPAMKAGVMAGDLIIQLDDLRVDSSSLDAADALLEAHDVPSLKLKIMRKGEDKPVETTLVRKLLSSQDVELQVRVDAGKVVVESTGVWPILDFDKGKPVVLSALSDHEFFADTDDHTASPSSGTPRARLPPPC